MGAAVRAVQRGLTWDATNAIEVALHRTSGVSLPRSLLCTCLPELPPGIDLEALELRTRTLNVLTGAGFRHDVALLRNTPLSKLLRIRGFGRECLLDLVRHIRLARRRDSTGVAERTAAAPHLARASVQWDSLDAVEGAIYKASGTSLPRSLLSRCLPELPRSGKLEDLGLRGRTLGALARGGFHKDVACLRKASISELLRIPGFGRESLLDLVRCIRRTRGPSAPEVQVAGPSDSDAVLPLDHVNRGRPIPHSLLDGRLPELPRAMSVHELRLRPRTLHALSAAGLDGDVNGLSKLSFSDLLDLDGFGVTSLADLTRQVMQALNQLHDQGSEATNLEPETAADTDVLLLLDIIDGGGSIPSALLAKRLPGLPQGTTVGSLRLLPRTTNALAAAGLDGDGAALSGLSMSDLLALRRFGVASLADLARRVMEARDQAAGRPKEPATLEEEFLDFIVGARRRERQIDERRMKEIVSCRYGFGPRPLMSLDSVGRRFGITKERVRQICTSYWDRQRSSSPSLPMLARVLSFVRELLPGLADSVESALTSAALIQPGTSLETVAAVATAVGRHPEFAVARVGKNRVAIRTTDKGVITQAASMARKLVGRFGAATVEDIHARLGTSREPSRTRDLCGTILTSLNGFRWLEESSGWFWLSSAGRNSLRARIRKVLHVAPKIRVSELRSAVRRDYRCNGVVPPTRVLLGLCRQLPECHVEGDWAVADTCSKAGEVLSGPERILVGVLLKHGPLCQRHVLQRLAAESGMSGPVFWRTLTYSPVLSRYGRGVYGLPGAIVPPGLVESLVRPRRTGDVLQDHGWTPDGRIWLCYKLSRSSLHSGVLSVPAAKRDSLHGSYGLSDSNGAGMGTLVVRESSLWGLIPFLRRTGAETGDFLVLQFNTAGHEATARLGNRELLDAMAAP